MCLEQLRTDKFDSIKNRLSEGNKKLLQNLEPSYLDFMNNKKEKQQRLKLTDGKKQINLFPVLGIEGAFFYRRAIRVRFITQDAAGYCMSYRNLLLRTYTF